MTPPPLYPLQFTLAKAYGDIVAFRIWGHQSNYPEAFRNVSIYISAYIGASPAGALCARGVNHEDTRSYIDVYCNQTVADARFLTFVRYINSSTLAVPDSAIYVNEIQPLRWGKCRISSSTRAAHQERACQCIAI